MFEIGLIMREADECYEMKKEGRSALCGYCPLKWNTEKYCSVDRSEVSVRIYPSANLNTDAEVKPSLILHSMTCSDTKCSPR